MKKERIDILLVEQGFYETREQAKRSIMAGEVYSEKELLDKPGQKIDITTIIMVKNKIQPYVSRGAYKLEKAVTLFHLELSNKIMLDIGASTGGFSDYGLQHGVKLTYALDVGTNQLHWKLRSDQRVIVLEKTNFRHVDLAIFKDNVPNLVTIDVSFISLAHIFPNVSKIVDETAVIVALIKPQFEAGKEEVGKKGIVREKRIHRKVIENVQIYANQSGLYLHDLTYSPITGGHGNIEFLGLFKKKESKKVINISIIVDAAHQNLEK